LGFGSPDIKSQDWRDPPTFVQAAAIAVPIVPLSGGRTLSLLCLRVVPLQRHLPVGLHLLPAFQASVGTQSELEEFVHFPFSKHELCLAKPRRWVNLGPYFS
jgi:hypothetical protein